MAQHTFSGNGTPIFLPGSINDHYVDEDTKYVYVAAGTGSLDDWINVSIGATRVDSVDPSTNAAYIGEHAVNTATKAVFVAVATDSVTPADDWVDVSGGGGGSGGLIRYNGVYTDQTTHYEYTVPTDADEVHVPFVFNGTTSIYHIILPSIAASGNKKILINLFAERAYMDGEATELRFLTPAGTNLFLDKEIFDGSNDDCVSSNVLVPFRATLTEYEGSMIFECISGSSDKDVWTIIKIGQGTLENFNNC